MENKILEKKIANYLKARKELIDYAKYIPAFSGNDNLIGRFGEYIAFKYLLFLGREPVKAGKSNEKGFDIKCGDGKELISVKLISSENNRGRTTRINPPWNELILIMLDENYQINKIGHIMREGYDKALINMDFKGSYIYASRKMLLNSGIICMYGNVIEDKKLFKELINIPFDIDINY